MRGIRECSSAKGTEGLRGVEEQDVDGIEVAENIRKELKGF